MSDDTDWDARMRAAEARLTAAHRAEKLATEDFRQVEKECWLAEQKLCEAENERMLAFEAVTKLQMELGIYSPKDLVDEC